MPRNFLKSGGTIPMLSTHAEKLGTRPPLRPPPIDARAAKDVTSCDAYIKIMICLTIYNAIST